MPFGMVSGVGRGFGVLNGGGNRRRKGEDWGEFGASHCNQWGLYCTVVRERRALPKLLWGGLVSHFYSIDLHTTSCHFEKSFVIGMAVRPFVTVRLILYDVSFLIRV